jgi:hypothetical protein
MLGDNEEGCLEDCLHVFFLKMRDHCSPAFERGLPQSSLGNSGEEAGRYLAKVSQVQRINVLILYSPVAERFERMARIAVSFHLLREWIVSAR